MSGEGMFANTNGAVNKRMQGPDYQQRFLDLQSENTALKAEVERLRGIVGGERVGAEMLIKTQEAELSKLQADNERLQEIVDLDKTYTNQAQVLYARVISENATLKAEVYDLKKSVEGHTDWELTMSKMICERDMEIATLKAEVERLKKVMEESLIGDSRTIDAKDRKILELGEKLGKAVEFIKQLDRLEIKQDTDSFLEEIGG